VAVVGIDEIELLAGELPTRQQRLTLAWAELHKQELLKDWNLLQNGEPPFKIKPLN
jgi:hypothetical protein